MVAGCWYGRRSLARGLDVAQWLHVLSCRVEAAGYAAASWRIDSLNAELVKYSLGSCLLSIPTATSQIPTAA